MQAMIKTPTVLVLGAGASCPYGFPSGRKLLATILEIAGGANSFNTRILQACGFGREAIHSFRTILSEADVDSIDDFLEHAPDFTDIAKAAIAICLLPCETHTNLFEQMVGKDSWYRYLFGQLNTSFDDFGHNRLSVITFNYDRLIEHYLHTVLKRRHHGKTDAQYAEKLRNIEVVHVHGSLGKLPWQNTDFHDVPYGRWADNTHQNLDNVQHVQYAAVGISTVHEEGEFAPIIRARELLHQAKRIYILGFGYHEENLKLLFPSHLKLHPDPFRGTALGLSPHRMAKALPVGIDEGRIKARYFERTTIYKFLHDNPMAPLD